MAKQIKKKKLFEYTVLSTPDEETGYFVVEVPALPGCVTQGKNLAEAKKNAREAMELYLKTLAKRKIAFPEDVEPNFLKSKISVEMNRCPA